MTARMHIPQRLLDGGEGEELEEDDGGASTSGDLDAAYFTRFDNPAVHQALLQVP
jgi:hypothetical protein